MEGRVHGPTDASRGERAASQHVADLPAGPQEALVVLIASIGNSTNNVVIARQTGQAWQAGQQRFFVITPDANMAEAMTAALLRAGVSSSNDVFTERVSPALVRVGLGREADDFLTYIRYARPDDNAAGERWRDQLPLTILRVRDTSGSTSPNPFAVPAYDQKTGNFDETALAGRWGRSRLRPAMRPT